MALVETWFYAISSSCKSLELTEHILAKFVANTIFIIFFVPFEDCCDLVVISGQSYKAIYARK